MVKPFGNISIVEEKNGVIRSYFGHDMSNCDEKYIVLGKELLVLARTIL